MVSNCQPGAPPLHPGGVYNAWYVNGVRWAPAAASESGWYNTSVHTTGNVVNVKTTYNFNFFQRVYLGHGVRLW